MRLFFNLILIVSLLHCFVFFQNECSHCGTCSTTLDCYVVDSSGYIIVADSQEHTSKFFGEVEGDIMWSMLNEKIFKKIILYDYQALCMRQETGEDGNVTSASALLRTVSLSVQDVTEISVGSNVVN